MKQLLFVFLSLYLFSCSYFSNVKPAKKVITIDFQNKSSYTLTFKDLTDSNQCIANANNPYPFRIQIPNPNNNYYYHIKSYSKGLESPRLAVKTSDSTFYAMYYYPFKDELLSEISFHGNQSFAIFAYNRDTIDLIIDSLIIEKKIKPQPSFVLDTLKLEISSEDYEEIKKLRLQAIERKIISKTEKKWFPAKFTNKTSLEANIRFKGDWTDHLKGTKWSFRVQLKDTSYLGMKEFSLQAPERRNFLKEWLIHEICNQEGIYAPYYDFVQLEINGQNLGIYNLEEHFNSNFKAFKVFKSPVLKIDEEGNWELNILKKKLKDKSINAPFFESASIVPYFLEEINSYKQYYEHYKKGSEILNLLKFRPLTLEESKSIDATSFGKLFALCDYFGAYHCLIYHNIRFVWNPITNQLQPVFYDGFQNHHFPIEKHIVGISKFPKQVNKARHFHYIQKLLNLPEVKQAYKEALSEYQQKYTLSKIQNIYANEIQTFQHNFFKEYRNYTEPWLFFEQRFSIIQRLQSNKHFIPDYFVSEDLQPCNTSEIIEDIGVKYFYQNDSIYFFNFNCNSTTVTAYNKGNQNKVTLPPYDRHTPLSANGGFINQDFKYLIIESGEHKKEIKLKEHRLILPTLSSLNNNQAENL